MKEVRRIRKEKGAVVGLPLYILIAVVVAAVSLAVILSFMVRSVPTLTSWDITPKVIYVKTANDSKAYYDPALNNNTYTLLIRTLDQDGHPMSDVKVYLSGCGVNEGGVTDKNGELRFNLTKLGIFLDKNVNQGEIKVVFKYQGNLGEEKKEDSILVIRK